MQQFVALGVDLSLRQAEVNIQDVDTDRDPRFSSKSREESLSDPRPFRGPLARIPIMVLHS